MMKRNNGPKAEFTKMPLDNMSAGVKAKAEAWLKADAAAKDAKKAFQDVASAAARKAKVIGANQYLAFGMGFGGVPAYTIKDVEAPKSSAPAATGPKF
jgi:protein-disulfide isomerase